MLYVIQHYVYIYSVTFIFLFISLRSRNNHESKLIRRLIPILLFYFLGAIPHAMNGTFHFTDLLY